MPVPVPFVAAPFSLPVAGPCFQVSGNNTVYYVSAQPIYQSPTSNPYVSIAQAGILSVLSVRDPEEYIQPPVPFDLTEADQLILNSVTYSNVPLPHIAMTQAQFNSQACNVATVINSWTPPLLVHCSSGDRASAAFAVFMIQFCGYTNAQAVAFATGSLALKNPGFVQYVTDYAPPMLAVKQGS
jgi:protein tyrosine phosphatase (PTP) superfamily phosphohydrolase (DUF442 family)